MDEFFTDWFSSLDKGLQAMRQEECERLFSCCAARCAKDALKYLYRDLFNECNGNLDTFFSRLNEIKDVDGSIIEPAKIYDILFKVCSCPLHTEVHVHCANLCECSRLSVACVMKDLVPDGRFQVEKMESILGGDIHCRFRIFIS